MTTTDRANTFAQVKKGYDPAEVDAHLDNLRRSFTAELESERQHIRSLEAELAAAKKREEAVHLTLIAATRTKDEMVAAASRKLEEATTVAEAEAETILKQAKYEAFRLVTEAREDADRLAAEAKQRAESVPAAHAEAEAIVTKAEEKSRQLLAEAEAARAAIVAEAEDSRSAMLAATESTRDSLISEARAEAMALLTGAKRDSDAQREEDDRVLAERHEGLKAETAALELHVASLKEEIARLEAELVAAPQGQAPEAPIADTAAKPASYTKTRFAQNQKKAKPAAEARAPIAAAVVEEPVPEPAVEEPAQAPGEPAKRGSFYSRRSAKLPRIGEESGRNALAAMSGLRGQVTANASATEEDAEEGERRGTAPDLAVQPA